MSIKQLQEKAREKFDELWDRVYIYKPDFYEQMPEEKWLEITPAVKDFLDTLIEQTYKQGREDLAKEIESLVRGEDYNEKAGNFGGYIDYEEFKKLTNNQ